MILPIAFNPSTGLLHAEANDGTLVINTSATDQRPLLTFEPLNLCPDPLLPCVTRGVIVDSSANLVYIQNFIIDADPQSPSFNKVVGTTPSVPQWFVEGRALDQRANVLLEADMGATVITHAPDGLAFAFFEGLLRRSAAHAGAQAEVLSTTWAGPAYPQPLYDWVPSGLVMNAASRRAYMTFVRGNSDEILRYAPVVVLDPNTGARIRELQSPHISYGDWDAPLLNINPVNGLLYFGASDGIYVVRDVIQESASTAAGTNVSVETDQATITFAGILAGGTTSITSIPSSSVPLALDGQFELTGGLAYQIDTTAVYPPPTSDNPYPVRVCFNVASINDEAAFNALVMMHGENGVWQHYDTTRDFATRQVCASVPSLSPFAVGRRKAFGIRPLYDTTKAFKAGSTAPIKIQVLGADGANRSSSAMTVKAIDLVLRSTVSANDVIDAGNANADSNFRFDPSLAGYIYNLKTSGLQSGTYDLRFKIADDGRFYATTVQIK